MQMGVSGIMIARQVPVFPFTPELWWFKREKKRKTIKKSLNKPKAWNFLSVKPL